VKSKRPERLACVTGAEAPNVEKTAAYQTYSNIEAASLWYNELLPGAETHEVGQCVSLHQAKAVFRFQRTVTVQMCQRTPGTTILVNETVYVAP
jgi:hypothetical protein